MRTIKTDRQFYRFLFEQTKHKWFMHHLFALLSVPSWTNGAGARDDNDLCCPERRFHSSTVSSGCKFDLWCRLGFRPMRRLCTVLCFVVSVRAIKRGIVEATPSCGINFTTRFLLLFVRHCLGEWTFIIYHLCSAHHAGQKNYGQRPLIASEVFLFVCFQSNISVWVRER